MVNTRGLVINGVILPDEPLHTHEGERVLITLLGSDNGTEDLCARRCRSVRPRASACRLYPAD